MTYVLVTRPLEASQQLADQLDVLGFFPIVMPLYTFSAREPLPEVTSAWSAEPLRQLAIFTSPRAVQYGLEHIPDEQVDRLECAAIGSATRSSLESRGVAVKLQAESGYSSEDLLQLPELSVEPGVAVIFCAPGGRETLATGLADMGWSVIKAMVYERIPLQPEAKQVDAIMAAGDLLSIWTSISALSLARKSLPESVWTKILSTPALVISSRIQHHLQQLGATRVEVAEGPGNTELVQSILRLTGH